MANICNYNIHVKGPRAAALMVYLAMPAYDDKSITFIEGDEEQTILHFEGDCKWSVDAYCSEKFQGEIDVSELRNIDLMDLDESIALDYWYITLQKKSELLGVEIQCHSWSDESEFNNFEHYDRGDVVDFSFGEYPYEDGLEFWEEPKCEDFTF